MSRRYNVNTAIILPYLTLPRNGVIHQGEIYNIKQEIRDIQSDARIDQLIAELVMADRN